MNSTNWPSSRAAALVTSATQTDTFSIVTSLKFQEQLSGPMVRRRSVACRAAAECPFHACQRSVFSGIFSMDVGASLDDPFLDFRGIRGTAFLAASRLGFAERISIRS